MFLYLRWLTREPKEKTGGLSESTGAPATGAARKLIGLDLGILKSGAQKTAVIGDQMTRRCKHSECRSELLPASKCSDIIQKRGFCSVECLAEHGREKANAAKERKARKELREYRERTKTLSQIISDAQVWVNRVVVAEDKLKGCISCQTGEVTDAGHYFHRGSKYRTSPLTLDRRNLTGQCRACNSYKGGGNQHEYRLGYIARYGQEAFDELCEYKASVDRGEVPSLTKDQAKAIMAEAKARLKELQKQS